MMLVGGGWCCLRCCRRPTVPYGSVSKENSALRDDAMYLVFMFEKMSLEMVVTLHAELR